MKQSFSTKWKASTQRRKQRKYGYNAPTHIRQKFLGAPLSPELRKKHGQRTLSIREGDKVKVLRGNFRGQTGKIDHVDAKRQKLYIEKMELVKKDGNKVLTPINPSNVQIIEIQEDKRRLKKTEKATKAPKEAQK